MVYGSETVKLHPRDVYEFRTSYKMYADYSQENFGSSLLLTLLTLNSDAVCDQEFEFYSVLYSVFFFMPKFFTVLLLTFLEQAEFKFLSLLYYFL